MTAKVPGFLVPFDYAVLDPETCGFAQERAERIHNLARMSAASIAQIGQYLTEVKARLQHGQFLQWIEREFAWKESSAERFMQVHRNFKSVNLTNMEIDVSALYLIAAPRTPEPVRSQVIQRAEGGEPVTYSGVRALVQRFAETGEIPDIQVSLPEMIAEQRAALARREPGPEPAPGFASPTQADLRERRRLEEQRRLNGIRASAFMAVVEAIETLREPELSMAEVAHDLRRYDTPDKDWSGGAKVAARTLASLIQELKE